ncbi:hypothetical protein KR222_008291, partial [Zaprionus bogoriensis]
FFHFICRTFTIGAQRAARSSDNKWNMLMPLLEYNKHIAKIPNCKMRSLRGSRVMPLPLPLLMLVLLLLLFGHGDMQRALAETTSGAPGAAATALGGAPGALNANLTDLGSPGVYNSTNG